MASADLLLHPVRLRTVKTFLGDRALTTSELPAELDDVPPGSLCRHVALLARAGVLQVAAERRVRGAVERTYTMRAAAAQIQPGEAMTPEEHTQAFRAYVAGLLADFDRYLATSPPDPAREAGYRAGAMGLTDAEFADLLHDLRAVFQPRLANPVVTDAARRMIYTVYLPALDQTSAADNLQGRRRRRPGDVSLPCRKLAATCAAWVTQDSWSWRSMCWRAFSQRISLSPGLLS